MTVERSWDVYEIALLIELYLDIQEGKIARSEGVQKLSGLLRQRARTLGYEVGPRFRNMNGVSFMLSSLTTLFTDGKRGSIRPPQIFKQTYKLYKTNRSNFASVLKTAHEQCAKDFTPKLLQLNKDALISNSGIGAKVKIKDEDIKLTTVEDNAKMHRENNQGLSANVNNKATESNKSESAPIKDVVSKKLNFLTSCCSKHNVQIKTLAHYIDRLNNLFLDKKVIKYGLFYEEDLEALKALRKNDNWRPLFEEAFTGGSLLLASLYFFYLLEYLEAQAIKEPITKELQANPQVVNISVADNKPSTAPVESFIYERKECVADDVDKTNIISEEQPKKTDEPFLVHDVHAKEAETGEASVKTLLSDARVLDDNKEEFCSVDFTQVADLTYTKPIKFLCFGEEKACGKSWADLFVNFTAVMLKEYPDLFKAGMSFSKIGKRIELVDQSDAKYMIAPKFIPGTNYALETNASAGNIIAKLKYILDLCHVDYANVVIAYERKAHSSEKVSNKKVPPVQQAEPISINEECASVQQVKLHLVNEEHASALESEPVFRNEEYASVLKANFRKGFRMESSIEIRKFRRYYAAQFGKELADSDELVTQNITRMCILHAGKAFLPAIMLSEELKEKLLRYIDDSFASGKKAIYFQALYNHFAQDFLDYPIHDADMLRAYLSHLQLDSVFIKYDFISRENM